MLGEKKIDENVNKINDLTYLLGKNFFTHAGFQSYLIFHSLFKTLTLHSPNYDKLLLRNWKVYLYKKLSHLISCSNQKYHILIKVKYF